MRVTKYAITARKRPIHTGLECVRGLIKINAILKHPQFLVAAFDATLLELCSRFQG